MSHRVWTARRSLIASLLASACGLQLVASSQYKRVSRRASTVAVAARNTRLPGTAMGTVRILLTGDVMLGRGMDQTLPLHCHPRIYESCVQDARDYVQLAVDANGPLPRDRSFAYPWGIALQDMDTRQPDVRLINLETAITTHDRPWPHKGINYRMHPGNVETLRAARIQACSLANNHVMDWCEEGLLDTLDTLRRAGIQYAGAGRDAEEAQRALIIPLPDQPGRGHGAAAAEDHGEVSPSAASAAAAGACLGHATAAAGTAAGTRPPGTAGSCSGRAAAAGGRVLIWALGHESSGVPEEWEAADGRPGVFVTDLSPADMERLSEAVRAEKREGRDVAVLSIHWGSNWGYDVPKHQQRFARALIDQAGVDIVHGHSSHHAKGCEVYNGKLIIYGAGDLISDYEGIRNASVEVYYPPDWYRDDVGLLWYADVSTEDGTLRQLSMVPTRLRHMRLEAPDPEDWRYIERTMDRECRKLGGVGVHFAPGGDSLLLHFAAMPQEE